MQKHPTREEILAIYDYDRERGVLRHRRGFGSEDRIAGTSDKGFCVISLPVKRRFKRAAIVWVLETGSFPRDIFHLDGANDNDKIGNLYTLPELVEEMSTADILNVFSYCKSTGEVLRRNNYYSAVAGNRGYKCPKGYLRHSVLGTGVPAHRIVWKLETGVWPDGEIDHINGVKDDNRIENLRLVDTRGNCINRPMRSDNPTGVNGVSFRPGRRKPYCAAIGILGVHEWLGSFSSLEEAAEARKAAEARHGFHPNHGLTREERAETT